ncbi:hypothetical protein [Dactylosporangium roseum]|uniref:hypothetical protein n=1 Tax=Dactylosporangium roseum TaxID=47989 RepID=UPI0031CF2410
MRLLHEHQGRAAAGLSSDLRFVRGDVGPHDLIRHSAHVLLVDQPVVDAFGGVPLLARSVQIGAEHVVDDRLERIQLDARGGSGLRGGGNADVNAACTVCR